MADFAIQRGTATITVSGSSVTITAGVDYTAPASASAGFLRIVGVLGSSAGMEGGDSMAADRNCTVISNPSNITTSITFTRNDPTTGPLDISWEIIEYTGAISGANEFIVRHEELLTTASTTSTSVDSSSISGVSTAADVVIFNTGVEVVAGNISTTNEAAFTAEYISGSTLARLTRGSTVDRVASISIAAVEFTGSNWAIQRIEHTYTSGATNETESITTLGSVSKAFLHHQTRVDGGIGPDSVGQLCFISSTSQLTFNKETVVATSFGVAWVIENTQASGTVMNVAQYSGTRATNVGGNPDSFTQAVTAVSSLAESSIMGEGANTTETTALGRVMLAFQLTDTTTVTMTRGRDIGNRDWRFQAVEWPTVAAAAAGNPWYYYAQQ